MPAKRKKKSSLAKPSRRTQIVWATFLTGITVVTSVLALQSPQRASGFLLTNIDSVGTAPEEDPILHVAKTLDRERWSGIVIHHSGEPAGDADSITRKHLAMGYQGLGYHFLIGNGNGLGDGVIHVGYRWNEQLPGAHVSGQQGETHNNHSIAICLIGNGDRRPFSDRQIAQLVNLVQRLQRQMDIPAKNVHLHRDLFSQTSSPGHFFAAARFHEQLRK